MNEQLRDRIARRLEALPDERGLQIIDYVEFLESKYAERSTPTNIFARLSDTVQDTMRAGKLPLEAISGTVGFFDGASKVMRGIASVRKLAADAALQPLTRQRGQYLGNVDRHVHATIMNQR